MNIYLFKCGFCHNFTGTRKGLRVHLKEHIRNEFTNSGMKQIADCRKNKTPQKWWIRDEFS